MKSTEKSLSDVLGKSGTGKNISINLEETGNRRGLEMINEESPERSN